MNLVVETREVYNNCGVEEAEMKNFELEEEQERRQKCSLQ